MTRTVIDLDDEIVAAAMRLYGTKTKAAAVRAAMEEAVKKRLRDEFFAAIDSGEFDLSQSMDDLKRERRERPLSA
ncbi:MAG: type II toxin-antitoxin system VapB family antitoxin [Streptomycetaceae bacterium]|nr:type II toxin-antitoxin system VapB family antitoxin [Streptomycetaceae bacterium]